jgi:hypothetical protein
MQQSWKSAVIWRKVLIVRRILLSTILLIFTASEGLSLSVAPSSSITKDGVWYWFQNCDKNKTLGIEVLLKGRAVFRSSFTVCLTPNPKTERWQKVLAFYFEGGQVYQGEYHTLPSQTIEGNIWQASSLPDGLMLGVSFATKKQVLLNTLHLAEPDKVSASEVDRDIVVRTFPLPSP